MVTAFVMALLRSLVLVILLVLMMPNSHIEAISLVFILWFAFIVPEHVNAMVWAKQPKELSYINAFSALAMLLLNSSDLVRITSVYDFIACEVVTLQPSFISERFKSGPLKL